MTEEKLGFKKFPKTDAKDVLTSWEQLRDCEDWRVDTAEKLEVWKKALEKEAFEHAPFDTIICASEVIQKVKGLLEALKP